MKLIHILFFAIITQNVFSTTEKITKSKIDNVTVFLRGAQVYRSGSVALSPGVTNVIFEDVEEGIDPKSIRAAGTGNFIILDVKHNVKYPTGRQNPKTFSKHYKEIKLLEDSLLMLDYDLEENTNKRDVLLTEKNTLMNNKIIKGEAKNDTLPMLKDALVFLREKLNNINSELLKLKKENQKLTLKRSRIQANLDELRSFDAADPVNKTSNIGYRIVITVSTETSTQANLKVDYLLQNAGWSPTYDLRTNATNTAMQLTYKARVYQKTGTDWNNVKLTLSTNNPEQNSIKPVLSPWYINYFNTYNNYRKNKSAQPSRSISDLELNYSGEAAPAAAEQKALSIADYTVMEENLLNVEYDINIPYTIPSDGETHIVAVQNKEIPAAFEHFAIPKIDPNAFLLARLTGWEDLNLIPGEANVFFEGTYVGATYIDPLNTNDTLDLSMGKDKSMVMKRVKLKDKTKEKVFGDEMIKSITYEITIRNTKSAPSIFTLEDQVPVSQNKEIKVEVKDLTGGKLDENTGKITWSLKLKPKETKVIQISYEVKYPKDKAIANL